MSLKYASTYCCIYGMLPWTVGELRPNWGLSLNLIWLIWRPAGEKPFKKCSPWSICDCHQNLSLLLFFIGTGRCPTFSGNFAAGNGQPVAPWYWSMAGTTRTEC